VQCKRSSVEQSISIILLTTSIFSLFLGGEPFAASSEVSQIHEVHVNSSAEEKRELLKSFLFMVLTDLYPKGPEGTVRPSDRQIRKIAAIYQDELDADVDVAKRYAPLLRKYFEQDPELTDIPTLSVGYTGVAFAQTNSKHITIDVELMRVNLAAGVADAKVLSSNPADRGKLVSDLFELKRNIKNASSGHWIVLMGDEDNPNSLLNLAGKMIEFRDAYSQAMSFVIAHELGHKVLGHLNRGCDCSKTIEQELAADRFAMFIIGLHEGEVVRKLRNENVPANASTTIPSDIFLERSYNLAGFEGLSECGCDYPAVAQRILLANEPFSAGYKIGLKNPVGIREPIQQILPSPSPVHEPRP
jgi:hypothetical protein